MSSASVRKFTMQARSPKRPSITALEQYTRPSAWMAVISRSLIRSSSSSLPLQSRGAVAEAADRQARRGHQLEVGVLLDQLAQVGGERDVVGDPARVGRAAVGQERDPDLQRREAAAELRPVHGEVDAVAGGLVEPDVGGVGVERAAEHAELAHQHDAGGLRRVKPLVRVDGDRVGALDAAQERRELVGQRPPGRRRRRRRGTTSRVRPRRPRARAAGRSSRSSCCRRSRTAQAGGRRRPRRPRRRPRARRRASGDRRPPGSRGPRRRPARACRRRGGSRCAPRSRRTRPPARRRRRPASRTAIPRRSSRAHFSATKLAIAPPVSTSPAAVSGSPKRPASQRVRCSSISVAAGASRKAPTFGLIPAASSSAAAAGTVPGPMMYATKPGWPL